MKKYKLNPLRDSIHDQTIKCLLEENSLMKRGNFYRECLEVFLDVEYVKDSFHGRPDTFIIDKEKKSITMIEIEDYHKLTEGKLISYGNLWSALDFYDISLFLHSFNRHGGNKQIVNLERWYYRGLEKIKRQS